MQLQLLAWGAEGQVLNSGERSRAQENGMEMHQGRISLGVRKMFFIESIVRLLRAEHVAPNMSVFKMHLDKALRNIV